MKKLVTIGLCLAAAAVAQTKISGTGKCGQPEKQEAIEAGDRPGHMLTIAKAACTWTTPFEVAGVKTKTYTAATTMDASGQKATVRGYVVVTMENGDKTFVRINQGTATMTKDGKPVSGEGTWSYTGGTGKFKGITGKGTYKSKPAGDTFEDMIEGEYSLPMAK
jgi:hypothetical protein